MAKDSWQDHLANLGFSRQEQQSAVSSAVSGAARDAEKKIESGEDPRLTKGRLYRAITTSSVPLSKYGYDLSDIEEDSPPEAVHRGKHVDLRWHGGGAYSIHSAATGAHIETVPLSRVGLFLKDMNSRHLKSFLQRQLEKHDKPT